MMKGNIIFFKWNWYIHLYKKYLKEKKTKKKTEHVTRCRWLLRIYFVESAKYSFLQIFYLNRWYQNERLLIENCPKFVPLSIFSIAYSKYIQEKIQKILFMYIYIVIYIILRHNMMNDASWLQSYTPSAFKTVWMEMYKNT